MPHFSPLPMKPHVLIVDDDPLFRALMETELRGDFSTESAKDGAEAFYLAQQRMPQAMVLDVAMPGWDGFATLAAFRAHAELRRVPVLLLTGDTARSTIIAAMDAGADDYLGKVDLERGAVRERLTMLCAPREAAAIS